MKKLISFVLALVCVLSLVGCQKSISGPEVYSFPEPTTQITGSFYSQGQETPFVIGSENYDPNDTSTTPIIKWFYDLKLTACNEPEAVEGGESYHFDVKGESAFTYVDRGNDEAYIVIASNWYKVKNPSTPPIEPEKADWGITLSVKDVTPTGMTLVCSQSGGEITGELQCGSDYSLLVNSNGVWTAVPYLVDEVAWTMEAYDIPLNDNIEFELKWERLYGELPVGTYRVVKGFMDFRDGGDYDTETYYTEFEITK